MPGISFANAPGWLQWVIAGVVVVGALTALSVLGRKAWQINRAAVAAVDLINSLPGRLTRIDDTLAAQDLKIEEIHHQTHENDGGSIKDGLKRVETQQKSMLTTQKTMLANQTRMERGIKGLYDRADVTDAKAVELRQDLEDTGPVQPTTRRKPPKGRTP